MRYGLSASNRGDFADRISFPAQSSVLDEEALFPRIVPLYDLPPAVSCMFFSRGDSDIYKISTVGASYYLKIYRPPHTVEKGEAEGRLVVRLLENGASVVPPIKRKDGAYATEIVASEGPRAALIFEEAPPGHLNPADESVCRLLGEAVARLHQAGDGIDDRAKDLLEGENLVRFVERLAYEEDYVELQDLERRISERLRAWPAPSEDSDIGWCHGDLVLCNIRSREDGTIVFFDFGNAGFISRSSELVRVRGSLRRNEDRGRSDELWQVFKDAYATVRPVPVGMGSSTYETLLRSLMNIRWIGGVMSSCPLRMGTEDFNPEWVRKQLEVVRRSVGPILEHAG
jgi:Ser/Thr protein kinase RdoA (MazF antagonist)